MKKMLLAAALAAYVGLVAAAPVIVTPGSNAGYMYFPKGSGSGSGGAPPSGSGAGITVDAMQLARTQCYTTSGTVSLPTGFTTGYIQAILVAGGTGGGATAGSTSITHSDIGTVVAPGGSSTVAGSSGGGSGDLVGGGGGGGGYQGRGGKGGGYAGGTGGGGGSVGGRGGRSQGKDGADLVIVFAPVDSQGIGYGEPSGGESYAGTPGVGTGSVGLQISSPAMIYCPNLPSAYTSPGFGPGTAGTGFGAGAGGNIGERGGNSGQINTVTWKYSGGPITVVVGAGAGGGSSGVVALRFIPQ